jgi:hypothetical protein
MPLRRFTATQFRRPMDRGINRPFLVLAKASEGDEILPVVVKSRAGYGDRPEAMLRELFSLMLARQLGLNTPEPVWLELVDGFDWSATDHGGYPELIRQSIGWNLGTIHLGSGWKPWIKGRAPASIPAVSLETAYAFDAMVQNSDRMADNPNLLWREDELAVLDFDKAFAWLRVTEQEAKPWWKTLERQTLLNHCLHSHLPSADKRPIIGQELWDEFEEWCLNGASGLISQEIITEISDPDLDLPRIEAYLMKLAAAADDFFRLLTDQSRP